VPVFPQLTRKKGVGGARLLAGKGRMKWRKGGQIENPAKEVFFGRGAKTHKERKASGLIKGEEGEWEFASLVGKEG